MKKFILILITSCLAIPNAFAQQRYIADQLFTYLHAGPNNTYRIIGSINAGEKVTLKQSDRKSGYSQITDSRGRTGWIESKFVTNTESMVVRLPRIEAELKKVKQQLAEAKQLSEQEQSGLVSSLEERNAKIATMDENYIAMSTKLSTAQEEIRELTAKLDTQKEEQLFQYFMYGGGVAGAGLFVGLILPLLIPRRKKQSNGGWS